MTSKDYLLIAGALRRTATQANPDARNMHRTLSEDIADALASDNPRFDRARFLAACGVTNDR